MMTERNDPTRSGFTPPAVRQARLSCNEVEALCFKAARGAGLSWGMAEEAGFAARWLYARGLDGPSALLAHLDWMQGRTWAQVRPKGANRGIDLANGGPLCPIALGTALSDFATLPDAGRAHGTAPVRRPVLVLPFLQALAVARGTAVDLAWGGGAVTVTAEGALLGDVRALHAVEQAELELSPGNSVRSAHAMPPGAVDLAAETISRLNAYAMRTTVPASATSRADAGATSGDND